MPATASRRKRTNFMISSNLLTEMSELVPSGQRSDFVNEALEDALNHFSIKKAFDLIEISKKKERKFHTTEEILNTIRHDRRF